MSYVCVIAWLITRMYALTAPSCVASWYGIEFQGNETASGLTYDMNTMVCASPTLPMGTILRLWNDSGEWITVRVVDAGPFATDSNGYAVWPLSPHPTRSLDLSRTAFDSLADLDDGLVTLRFRILGVDQTDMIYNTHIPAGRLCELMNLSW